MNRNNKMTLVMGLLTSLAFLVTALPAVAMNDPVTGRWTTRDPLAYNHAASASIVLPHTTRSSNLLLGRTPLDGELRAARDHTVIGQAYDGNAYLLMIANPLGGYDPDGRKQVPDGAWCWLGGNEANGLEGMDFTWRQPYSACVDDCSWVHEQQHVQQNDSACRKAQGDYQACARAKDPDACHRRVEDAWKEYWRNPCNQANDDCEAGKAQVACLEYCVQHDEDCWCECYALLYEKIPWGEPKGRAVQDRTREFCEEATTCPRVPYQSPPQ
jgi:hypothetical protein